MNTPIVITPVTQAQITAMAAELTAGGSVVTESSPGLWTIEGHGIGAMAAFDGSTLTVNVVHKPFYVPESSIESGLRKALGE